MSEVVLREAVLSDYESWRAVYSEVAGEGLWIGGESAPPDEDMRPRFTVDVEASDRLIVVADDPERGVIGGLFCHFNRPGVGYLGMQLLGPWRGQGLGGRLLGYCIEWCRSQGAHKIALEAWPHNGRAISLYRRHGFEIEGRIRRHYRRRNGELWDAVIMGLVLDTASPGSPHADGC